MYMVIPSSLVMVRFSFFLLFLFPHLDLHATPQINHDSPLIIIVTPHHSIHLDIFFLSRWHVHGDFVWFGVGLIFFYFLHFFLVCHNLCVAIKKITTITTTFQFIFLSDSILIFLIMIFLFKNYFKLKIIFNFIIF